MEDEPNSTTIHPTKAQQKSPPKPFSNFLYKAIFVFALIAVLPLFPSSQSLEFANKTVLSKSWELVHLLLVGIAISYGLFSSRNSDDAEIEKEEERLKADTTSQSYISSISSVFDDEEIASPKDSDSLHDAKNQTWSYSQYYPEQPVVMVAEESTDDNNSASTKPLFLPVRSLKPRSLYEVDESLFMSNDTNEVKEESPKFLPSRTPSFQSQATHSPKRQSPPSSLSREMRGKTNEDLVRRKSFSKPSPPPAPPPPPQPLTSRFGSEKRDAMKSFKNEIEDKSRRGFLHRDDLSSDSFKPDKYSYTGVSVRTARSKDAQNLPPLPENQRRNKKRFTVDSESSDDDDDSEFSDVDEKASESNHVSQEAAAEENEVDKKADEFIAKFREQIRLQRIASIKRSSGQRVVRNPK